ncbi:MAG: 4Fe-4S binding protein [Chloroflexaceae bacterium]|nr:4Fe-4S binding protein [Chloroflexaceae bacterium]
MFARVSEQRMHLVRWVLIVGWLTLITSLFWDPISKGALTEPGGWLAPPNIDEFCVYIQGKCYEYKPFQVGNAVFWGMIIPAGVFILFVFGHELWRRICPLSFFSQIPRALGWQRKRLVKPDSWLGRNALYLQMGLLFVGLNCRLLFINGSRWMLGSFLLITLASALAVGFLYGGKTWCNYFCPMNPVQRVYSEPGGLLTSKAHLAPPRTITQSMCRTSDASGQERTVCVACNSPCFDIDAERSHWDGIQKLDRKILYYCYVGLAVGYFTHYYLYAGNWFYYFSGIWAQQDYQLATLFSPGFYIMGQTIAIPKIIGVPLTLGLFTAGGFVVGTFIEKQYKAIVRKHFPTVSNDQAQHQLFTLATFFIINFFFIFGGRPFIILLPVILQFAWQAFIVGLSVFWLVKNWNLSAQRYGRERDSHLLRRQLGKLDIDYSQVFEGRSLDNLNPDELYAIAKFLPKFTENYRLQVYRGVLLDALEQKTVEPESAKEAFQRLRQELGVNDLEHVQLLDAICQENPLLCSQRRMLEAERTILQSRPRHIPITSEPTQIRRREQPQYEPTVIGRGSRSPSVEPTATPAPPTVSGSEATTLLPKQGRGTSDREATTLLPRQERGTADVEPTQIIRKPNAVTPAGCGAF